MNAKLSLNPLGLLMTVGLLCAALASSCGRANAPIPTKAGTTATPPTIEILLGSDVTEMKGDVWPMSDKKVPDLMMHAEPVRLTIRLADERSFSGVVTGLFVEIEQHRIATVGFTPLEKLVPFEDAVSAARATYEHLKISASDRVWKRLDELARRKPTISSYGTGVDLKGNIEVFIDIKQYRNAQEWYIAVSLTDKSLYPSPPGYGP